jgi:hypothetical protein
VFQRDGVVMKRILLSGAAAALVAVLAFAAPPARAAIQPNPTVGGWADPMSDIPVPGNPSVTVPRTLDVRANSDGNLTGAWLYVDGVQFGFAPLCASGSSSTCTPDQRQITFETKDVPDGEHHVTVLVTDDQGASAAALDRDIDFHNAPPDNHPSATLTIGSSGTTNQEPGGSNNGNGGGSSGGVEGASKSSCTSPKLSMALASKPLRISHGVPVLLKNKSYKFVGRLTCVIANKRQSAPKGVRVDLLNVVKGRTVHKPGLSVGSGGKLSVKLKYASARTIEFRFRAADGRTSTVSIKVRIATKKR